MHSGPAASGPVSSGPVPGGSAPTGPVYGGPYSAPAAAHPVEPPTEAGTDKPRKRKSRKPLMVGLAVFAVLFMIIGGGGTYLVMDRVIPVLTDSDGGVELADVDPSPEPSEEPSDEPEPSPTDEPVEAATDLPSEDPSADPSEDLPEEAEPGSTLLTQMESVDSSSNTYWRPKTGRAEIDGQAYNRAIISGYCMDHNSRCTGWEDYNLSRDWTTFTVTIGVDDSSSSSATTTFTVHVDGDQKVTETLRLGEVKEIEVPVDGALRLRIEVESDNRGIYPVWADPTLTSD